ncbi:anhydro-N-acetylmuramic acid kinase [Flavobacterium adhaerens]|uniref:anhydro-N-acetylmuramic acid kinase n=1 Tax=Flavobacterium adhaerens TaxID=3149043 RepID=UPI0032B4D553
MKKDYYNVIGVMSGTSLDGVDLAHIQFHIKNQKWSFEILECETVPYSSDWISILKTAVDYSENQLSELNKNYTELLSSIIVNFINKYTLENVDAICSHGHTILHQPHNGFTLQIGNLPEIAVLTQQKVICNFRVQDVALGGQGAPLVPIGDRILFSEYEYCMNLGGFSNVSFERNNIRIAFDISAVNTVLNFYANLLGKEYDNKGQISKTGILNHNLLNELNALDFYKKAPPKSLGFEFVKEIVLPIIQSYPISIEDKLHTYTEHIAFQIAIALNNFEKSQDKKQSMFVTGGGAYNDFLIERMQYHLPEMKIIIPSRKILEYKEALIFGLLGVLKMRGEVNALQSVTGAIHDHSSGVIYNI